MNKYICPKCGAVLIPSNMGKSGLCKTCTREYFREYRRANRTAINEYQRNWIYAKRLFQKNIEHDLGPALDVKTSSKNGKLSIYINGEKL